MDIILPNNWYPRPYQVNAWKAREQGCKRFALVWHRRAGKDDFALHSTAVEMHKRPATYWHMLPQANQARKAIWEAVNPHTGLRRIDEAFPLPLRASTRENDMTIKFKNGSIWHVVGSDNYDSLVGSPPAGVVFSEWPLAKPEAWAFLRPILAENDGWAMFIYTPRGPNHGLSTYQLSLSSEDWFGELLTVEDTKVFTDKQIRIERAEYINDYGNEMGEALFQQEYYCNFEAAVIGSIYGQEIKKARDEGRICSIPHDPYKPVGTMWDLGYTDDTSILFYQMEGPWVNFIDCYAANNVELAHYADVLRMKQESRGYKYDQKSMFFPHDVEQHELIAGKSRKAILRHLGIPVVVVPRHNLLDGIQNTRRQFYRFRFDSDKCSKLVEALQMYQREWDQDTKTFSPKPKHDWTSHYADALRIGSSKLPRAAATGIVQKSQDRYRDANKRSDGPPTPWAM
jgi:phage terminase large subunit